MIESTSVASANAGKKWWTSLYDGDLAEVLLAQKDEAEVAAFRAGCHALSTPEAGSKSS